MLLTRLRQLADLARLSWLARNPWRAYGFLRRGRRPDNITLSYAGMKVAARKQDWLAVREVLFEDEYKCIDGLFDPNAKPKVLDLGANIGCFALRAFRRVPEATIVSVEAAADTADILEQNRRNNPTLNWTVLRGAVWKCDEPVHLTRMNNSASHRVGIGDGAEQVEGLSLATILSRSGWESVDLVKMDIEGAESEVFSGGSDILSQIDQLIIEIHDDRIDGAKILEKLAGFFSYWHRVGTRKSTKPLLLLSKSPVSMPADWAMAIDPPGSMSNSASPA